MIIAMMDYVKYKGDTMKNKSNLFEVYDPRGQILIEKRNLSNRKNTLDGLRLAILDNSKWNANKILRGSADALSKEIKFSKINYYVKKHGFSTDAPLEMIDEITNDNDIVLTAIGDCGSCCSSCIRDAITLEDRGIPAAPIITTEFINETKLTRVAIGMPDLRPVVIDHPVSSITNDEVLQRVKIIKEQAQEVWLGQRKDI